MRTLGIYDLFDYLIIGKIFTDCSIVCQKVVR